MPVKINSIAIVPELTTQSTDYLLGQILGKYVATIDCEAEWIARAGLTASSLDMVFTAIDKKIVWNGGSFEDEGFLVGDSIYIVSTSNTGIFTIATISGNEITTTQALIDETSEDAVIKGITDCTGIRFRYNLIENLESPTYNSKTDNNELLFTGDVDRNDTSYDALVQQGVYASNHLGSSQVKGGVTLVVSASATNQFTFVMGLPLTITQTNGNWIAQGFQVGQPITITGTASNDVVWVLTNVTASTLTLAGVVGANEVSSTAVLTGGYQRNRFVIEHTFYITPFFLLAHLSDIQDLIAPDYFFNAACLKYLYNIKLLYTLSNPNKLQDSGDQSMLGNTGWFNENFNGNVKKYSFTQRAEFFLVSAPSTEIDYVDYTAPTKFEIYLTSADSAFSATDMKLVVSHFILPEAESEYVDTATDQDTNFMFDRVLVTVDNTLTQSSNNTTAKQVLKNVKYVYSSASSLFITGEIDLSSAYKTRIAALTDRKLVLSVTIQDKDLTTQTSDIVCLVDENLDSDGNISAVRYYSKDNSNPDVGTAETVFNQFPYPEVDNYSGGFFVEDTIRSKTIISVDTSNGALIEDITLEIKAVKNTGDEFVLETKTISFASAPISGGVQIINFSEGRNFVLGATAPFNTISLARRSDLDTGNFKFYELIYPFKLRWEDFIALTGVDTEFYDTSENNNGYNQDWNRYFAEAGWGIQHLVTVNIEENDYVNAIEAARELFVYDYEQATDWSQEIKVFDIDSSVEIPNNMFSDKIVRVQAIFTKLSGATPAITGVEGMIEYEPFEQGGINVIRNINTIYPTEANTPFISVLSNYLLKKEKSGSVYTLTANIDGRELTGDPKISARIYEECVQTEIEVEMTIKGLGNADASCTFNTDLTGNVTAGTIVVDNNLGDSTTVVSGFTIVLAGMDQTAIDNALAAATIETGWTVTATYVDADTIEWQITSPAGSKTTYNTYEVSVTASNWSTDPATPVMAGGLNANCTLYLTDAFGNVIPIALDFEWNGDGDGSGVIDAADLAIFAAAFGAEIPADLTLAISSYTGTPGDVDVVMTLTTGACDGLKYYGLSVGASCNDIVEITNTPVFEII